jgi:cell division protein FtsQ
MRNRIRKNRYKSPTDQPPKSIFMRVADVVFKSLCSVAFIGGMSLMFIFGHDALTQCDYFKAQNIIIRGDSRLAPEQIMNVARINKGTNILSVNLPTIRKRLLTVPWISTVDVYREFPGTIIIFIKEHKPLAVLDLGRPFLVNQRGEIFKEASANEVEGLPVIRGVDCADWKTPGSSGTQVYKAVMEILKMGEEGGAVISNQMLKAVQADREIGLCLEIDSYINQIKLGYGKYRTKFERLDRIFTYIKDNDSVPVIQALDLRDPDHVSACLGTEQPSEEDKKEVSGEEA